MLEGYFLGDRRFRANGQELPILAVRRAGALLAFLMINRGQRFTREALVEQIWDTLPSRPTAAISHELWVIKDQLKRAGIEPERLVCVDGQNLSFREDAPYRADFVQFQAAFNHANDSAIDPRAALPKWQRAAELYGGALLPDLYDDWCHFPRALLRDRYLTVLERILDIQEQISAWDDAIATAKLLLENNPLLEYAHRSLMRCYLAKGSRPSALQQFNICKSMLAREFETPVEPMAETRALRDAILAESEPPERAPRDNLKRPLPQQTLLSKDSLSSLKAAQTSLSAAHRQIESIMREQRNR